MTDTTHAIALHNSVMTSLLDTANTLFDAFVAKMTVTPKNVQITRLTQAMHRMDDAQLADVGITRSEIADYANIAIRLHG